MWDTGAWFLYCALLFFCTIRLFLFGFYMCRVSFCLMDCSRGFLLSSLLATIQDHPNLFRVVEKHMDNLDNLGDFRYIHCAHASFFCTLFYWLFFFGHASLLSSHSLLITSIGIICIVLFIEIIGVFGFYSSFNNRMHLALKHRHHYCI